MVGYGDGDDDVEQLEHTPSEEEVADDDVDDDDTEVDVTEQVETQVASTHSEGPAIHTSSSSRRTVCTGPVHTLLVFVRS